MARNDGSAYDAIVEGVIASILEGIKAGEVDEDSLNDRIHEECDNAPIYTSDQWVCAYLNLRSAVSEHDFTEALAVAQDAAEETTPEEPREEVTP